MEFIRQLIEISPNPIYVRDEQGEFVFMNDAYAQLHGQSAALLLKRGTVDFDSSYDKDLFILKSNESNNLEKFYSNKNGHITCFQSTKKPFVNANGKYYLLSILTDITSLKNKLHQTSEKIKTAPIFLSNLRNEFRTEVNVITNMARLLKKSSITTKQEEYLHIIEPVASDILEASSNDLEFTNIETNAVPFKSVSFDVGSILHFTLNTLEAKLNEKNLSFSFKKDFTSIPLVLGDPNRLNQLLFHVITLFIKYTRKGSLKVTADIIKQLGNTVYIHFLVENTEGIIGTEKIKYYLENLTSDEQKSEYNYNNLDVKFKICKKIVELQQGRIWLENKPNDGSRINLIIPFRLSEKIILAEEQEVPSQIKGIHILLAEDNPANQLLVVSQLKYWEAEVDVAHNGQEAWEQAKAKGYDLILMDIDMPLMNGFEATAIIRKEANPNQDTPIIAFTANAFKIDINRYKESGFSDYLFKPYPETSLYLAVFHNIKTKAEEKQQAIAAENNLTPTVVNNLVQVKEPQLAENQEPINLTTALYDFSGLGNLAEDATFVRKMQQLFIDLVPGQLEKLSNAITQADWHSVSQIAHSLKSTYGNIGIRLAAQAATKIEEISSKKSDFQELGCLMQTVTSITDGIIAVFQEQLQAEVKV